MRKKLFILFMTLVLGVTVLSGCGAKGNDSSNTETQERETETEQLDEDTEIVETTEVMETTEVVETTEVESETTETVESEPEETAPTYTYTDMSATKYAQRSVNVRSLPSTSGEKLGALSLNQEVKVTGQCNETGWYRIDFNGGVAYVSNSYLGDAKVEVQEAPPANDDATTGSEDTTNNSGATAPTNEPCPYTLYVIQYDSMGYPYFYGKWGGSANMDADNWAKTDACMKQADQYMFENARAYKEDGSWTESHAISWQNIGVYDGVRIVVRYVDIVNDVKVGSPESRGIATAGNGRWE